MSDAGGIGASLQGMMRQADAAGNGAPLRDKADAAAVLATGHEYVRFGQRAIEGLDRQIGARSEKIGRMEAAGSSGKELEQERGQVALLTALRDRIAESVEKVSKILAGEDEETGAEPVKKRRKVEEEILLGSQDLLRQRLMSNMPAIAGGPPSAQVAAAYSAN